MRVGAKLVGSVQSLLRVLCSGLGLTILLLFFGDHMGCWDWTVVATCKANSLPTVLLLQALTSKIKLIPAALGMVLDFGEHAFLRSFFQVISLSNNYRTNITWCFPSAYDNADTLLYISCSKNPFPDRYLQEKTFHISELNSSLRALGPLSFWQTLCTHNPTPSVLFPFLLAELQPTLPNNQQL